MIDVTIITPVFNGKDYLKETIQSVVSQTHSSWEWIIIDDCSTDGSFEFIKELTLEDNRIVVLQMPKNSGTAAARNLGLKHARGRYITFLDADDLLDSNYLECQLDFMKIFGPIITASYRRRASSTCTDFNVPEKTDYKAALKGNPMSCLTTMFDKEVIGDLLFDETFKRHEDYIFWLEILKRGHVCYGNQKVLATYVIHKNSKNFKKTKLVKSMYRVYHESQKMNWLKSWVCVARYAFYSRKKYKNVK